MNKTKIIYFLSAMVCIIGCYTLNLSYSLFVQTEEKEVVNATVPSLSYSLELADSTNTSTLSNEENNTINVTIPATSEEIVKLKVINSGTSDIKYGISVSDSLGTTIQLVELDDASIIGALDASHNEGETTNIEEWIYVTNPTDTEITLTINLTAKYNTLNFDEETFTENSNIDCVNTIKLLNNAIIARAKSVTESDSQTNGYAMYSPTPLSTPLIDINSSNESTLSIAEDDHGDSYYFRGNVQDNYVEFKGMCFRIVRIEGDGAIKLIYAGSGKCSESNETSGYIKNNGHIIFGFKPGAEDLYLHDYFNYEEGLKTTIEDWLNNNFTESDKQLYLKKDKWCFGGSENKKYDGTGTIIPTGGKYTDLSGYSVNGIEYTSWNYYVRNRLEGINTEKYVTLKCYNEDEYDENYVGALTADEVIYAGTTILTNSESNKIFYLYENTSNDYYNWWTTSLNGFTTFKEYVYVVNGQGLLGADNVTDTAHYTLTYARPVITLLSNAIIDLGGNGTKTNPYVIK